MHRFLVVGCGFAGAVLAQQLASTIPCRLQVWDERSHIGGNCHTARDAATGIMIHTYGPHIFNTDRKDLWDYVNSFGELVPFINRVKACYKNKVYSMPINLHTINQFFGVAMRPAEAQAFLETLTDKTIGVPQNFEEQALKFMGREMYEAFFYGYTQKQWGCEPRELPASILKRLPIRFCYNDNYYGNAYQGIPRNGYTEIFEKILAHPSIETSFSRRFSRTNDLSDFDHIFYTGPIDAFFDYKHGPLAYRTVTFEEGRTAGDYQGNAVINYGDLEIPYTRIHEHKHFTPWEQHAETVYFREYSKETGANDVPYYPKRLTSDKQRFDAYRSDALGLKRFSFLGRLGTYRYMDMHHVIGESIDFCRTFLDGLQGGGPLPIFPEAIYT